jgi:Peptidase A4 family/Putative Ig domain
MQVIRLTAVCLLLFTFCYCAAPADESANIAKVSFRVVPATETRQFARVQVVNGKKSLEVREEDHGQTLDVPEGTIIFLRFPSASHTTRFVVDPPGGVLESPAGIYHMPNGVVGLLKAVGTGTATVTVRGFGFKRINNKAVAAGNPSGSTAPNWSGYASLGGPFTSIMGQWTVPTVQTDGGDVSSSWVGIDGFGNTSLIQVGTEQDYDSGLFGGIAYYAWWEILPAGETRIPQTVMPGDEMIAWIFPESVVAPNTSGTWAITIQDVTQNWAFYTTQTYSGPLASAEWIEEATTECGLFGCSIHALADYGSITFDIRDFLDRGNPGLSPSQSINMVQGGAFVSTPSNPDGDTDGFTANFGSNPPSPPGPFITTTHLPNAVLHQAYQHFLSATGAAAFEWSLAATAGNNLPPGLQLSQSTGTVSGTPTQSGTFTFNVVAVDSANPGASSQIQPLTLTVLQSAPPPPPPDFGLFVSPLLVRPRVTPTSCSGTATVRVTPVGGFNRAVNLSATEGTLNPPATTATSLFTISAGSCDDLPNSVQVTGTSGNLTHSTTIRILVPVPKICGKPGVPLCP